MLHFFNSILKAGEILMRYQGENGLTLVEIVASIAILSIVMMVFATFFTQSAMFSNKNERAIEATNLARAVLEELRYTPESIPANVPNETTVYEAFHQENELKINAVNDDGSFKTNVDLRLRLTVSKEEAVNLYKVKVEVIDDSSQVIADTYGYVEAQSEKNETISE